MGESDWRVGLSVRPKYRGHPDYYEPPATVIAVEPAGTGGIVDSDGVLRLGRGGRTFLAPAGEWVTA